MRLIDLPGITPEFSIYTNTIAFIQHKQEKRLQSYVSNTTLAPFHGHTKYILFISSEPIHPLNSIGVYPYMVVYDIMRPIFTMYKNLLEKSPTASGGVIYWQSIPALTDAPSIITTSSIIIHSRQQGSVMPQYHQPTVSTRSFDHHMHPCPL